MNKIKLLVGIILFGSLWGFSECIFGTILHNTQLPAGAIMTGLFAVSLMVISRILFRQPGMQFGMAMVAGILRFFSPLGDNLGYFICSAIAIMAEGIVFELIWYRFSLDSKELESIRIASSMGIITAYCCYVSGYIITQILTPIASGATFYIENLIIFMPNILGSGLIAAIIGGTVLPLIMSLNKLNLTVKDKMYYPTSIGISIICWLIIVGNWFMA